MISWLFIYYDISIQYILKKFSQNCLLRYNNNLIKTYLLHLTSYFTKGKNKLIYKLYSGPYRNPWLNKIQTYTCILYMLFFNICKLFRTQTDIYFLKLNKKTRIFSWIFQKKVIFLHVLFYYYTIYYICYFGM